MKSRTFPDMRREFLRMGLASPLIAFFPLSAAAAPRLDPSNAAATALEYTHDASTVSGEKRGGADRVCANCRFFKGGDAEWGGCDVFPGKEVNRNGWCKSWAAPQSG